MVSDMSKNTSKLNELRQRMEVAVSTYFRLNGSMPDTRELYKELGSEYAPVIGEYSGKVKTIAC